MAAAAERFSIRNYAATMRDAAVDPPLPPIPVRRYRWWTDVLADLIPAADFSQEIPSVPRDDSPEKKDSESPSKGSADEDFRSPNGTSRTPMKIRTMAEIFASSSPIEDVEMAPEEEKKAAGTRKRKRKGKKEKNVCKSKMMSSTRIHSLREPTYKKKFRKNAQDGDVVENKKFEEVKPLPKAAELIKCQRRRTKHVTFSDKDDILGGSKKSSRTKHPQITNPCKIFSKVMIDSSTVNNSSTNHKTDINAMAIDIIDSHQVSDSHNDTAHHRSLETGDSGSEKEAPLAVMIDLNQAVETNSDDEKFWDAAHREVSINSAEIHQESGLANTSTLYPMPENHSPNGGSAHDFSAHKDVELDIEVNPLEIMSKEVFDAGSYQRDHQSEWCLNQYHPEKIHHELNFIEITDSERLNIRNREVIEDEDGFLRSDSNKRRNSLRDYAVTDSLKKAYLREICNVDCRPTMRLMGKNVVVDGSNRYCQACGRSRTDQECRIGQSLFSIMPERNLPKHWIQPERSDSPSIFYDWKPRLSRNADESVGTYNSEVSFEHMMSGSINSKHKSAAYEPQIRYHDRESLKPSQIQISSTLPHWLLHAKCSEGNHLATSPYHVHNLPPAPSSALAPSSCQSSSILTGTNSNSEVFMNTGLKNKGMYGSHTNSTEFRNPEASTLE